MLSSSRDKTISRLPEHDESIVESAETGSRSVRRESLDMTVDLLERICNEIESRQSTMSQLLEFARPRLLRLINLRMSEPLGRRLDAEDILQETFVIATKRQAEFFKNRTVPVFVWLRGLALERLVEANRFHLGATKRAAGREISARQILDQSSVDLLNGWACESKSPSRVISDKQRNSDIANALAILPEHYREILVLRFFEALTVAEAAATMQISVSNAKVIQFRALKQLEKIIIQSLGWQSADREA